MRISFNIFGIWSEEIQIRYTISVFPDMYHRASLKYLIFTVVFLFFIKDLCQCLQFLDIFIVHSFSQFPNVLSITSGPGKVLRNAAKDFFFCGIRDWLKNFAENEIQIAQTLFGMRDRTKNSGMRETTWFSRGIRDPYTPIGGPFTWYWSDTHHDYKTHSNEMSMVYGKFGIPNGT